MYMEKEKLTVLVLMVPDEIIERLDGLCASSGCSREEMALELLRRGAAAQG